MVLQKTELRTSLIYKTAKESTIPMKDRPLVCVLAKAKGQFGCRNWP